MKISGRLTLLLAAATLSLGAQARKLPTRAFPAPEKDLYGAFRNPDSRYRPYVRWWWNGSRVAADEIVRELDLLHEAGIGGVEINTISFPERTDSVGYAALPWLSDAWIRMVQTAADACRERGMVCDIIVGSGWPFGAEFLTRDEQIRQLYPVTIDVPGGQTFTITRDEILAQAAPQILNANAEPGKRLLYLRLMPKRVERFTEGIVCDGAANDETIRIDVPQGDHVLYAFVELTGYMNVLEGAPGARGPVVNHLDGKAVKRYLDRFSDRMHFRDGMLKGKIRAAFCDSFELEGDNWDGNMLAEFEKRKGYSLYPYLLTSSARSGRWANPCANPTDRSSHPRCRRR